MTKKCRSNREDGLYYVNPEKEMAEEESLFESAQMDPVIAVRHVCG